uniref:DUF4371 domain-containing protein n=2 Tax=Trichogramma kaykai TaxID=54128 RepID=A0ABD2VWT0_9HYME
MGPFLKDSNQRSFSSDYYYLKTNDSFLKLPRLWLCYSKVLEKAYCEHCWLFADPKNPHFRWEWIEGINVWQGLSKKIKKHVTAAYHCDASLKYDMWKNKKTKDNLVDVNVKEQINFWVEVLKPVVDVIPMLSSCTLALRGHDERKMNESDVHNRGNFLSVIELLAKYNGVLYSVLNPENKRITYLSPETQNELISFLSFHIKKTIIKDIQESKYFTIILDTTQDISKKDQLSVIIRFVNIDSDSNNNFRTFIVQECF